MSGDQFVCCGCECLAQLLLCESGVTLDVRARLLRESSPGNSRDADGAFDWSLDGAYLRHVVLLHE